MSVRYVGSCELGERSVNHNTPRAEGTCNTCCRNAEWRTEAISPDVLIVQALCLNCPGSKCNMYTSVTSIERSMLHYDSHAGLC